MLRHAQRAGASGLAFVSILALACSDTVPSAPRAESRPVSASMALPPSTRELPGASVLSGHAADSALRARASLQALSGDRRLAVYLDTSDVWNSILHRPAVSASREPGDFTTRSLPDLTGTGTPPNVIDASYFPKPQITGSSTVASISGNTATFASSMVYFGGTGGQSDLTHEVHGRLGDIIYPQRTATFTGIADGVFNCIQDITLHPTGPSCYLWGSVTGLITIGLPRSCDLIANASSLHNAWLTLPLPSLSISSGGAWAISLFAMRLWDAPSVGDVAPTATSPNCEPEKERRKTVVGDGGSFSDQFIIFPPDAPASWKCFANQERTVYLDGSPAGQWYTVSVDCGLYASVGVDMNGALPSASSPGTPTTTVTTVPFTLAGVASLPNHARAQVIRRSAGRAESEPDVIELPTNSATADDLADAVREFLDANASARPGADATTPISNTGKGNSSKVGNRSKVYENLLKELRKADHKTIDAVGDAGTIKVLVIQ